MQVRSGVDKPGRVGRRTFARLGAAGACLLLLTASVGHRFAVSRSWRMMIDLPTHLQFAAYIGQREGFTAATQPQPTTQAEQEWRAWWEGLPAMLRALAEWTDQDSRDAQRQSRVVPPVGFVLDPPDFRQFDDRPALGDLCRHHWAGFAREWDRVKPSLVALLQAQLTAVRVQELVRQCQRAAGKRTHPFTLRVDFVGWPHEYERVEADNHLVLGAAYLTTARTDDLRALLRTRVTQAL